MKKQLLFLLLPCLFVACAPKQMSVSESNQVIQTGDLLSVALPADYNLLDSTAGFAHQSQDTCPLNYIHTAILDVDEEGVWIIDATLKRGVARYPLDTFLRDFTLNDGSYPYFEVLRLKDNSAAQNYVDKAKMFVGEAYDTAFTLNNEKHYCTELIYDAYCENNKSLFEPVSISFCDENGKLFLYWQQLFDILKIAVPQGKTGLMPYDVRHSSLIETVNIQIPTPKQSSTIQ